jgi:hypothetical protein
VYCLLVFRETFHKANKLLSQLLKYKGWIRVKWNLSKKCNHRICCTLNCLRYHKDCLFIKNISPYSILIYGSCHTWYSESGTDEYWSLFNVRPCRYYSAIIYSRHDAIFHKPYITIRLKLSKLQPHILIFSAMQNNNSISYDSNVIKYDVKLWIFLGTTIIRSAFISAYSLHVNLNFILKFRSKEHIWPLNLNTLLLFP